MLAGYKIDTCSRILENFSLFQHSTSFWCRFDIILAYFLSEISTLSDILLTSFWHHVDNIWCFWRFLALFNIFLTRFWRLWKNFEMMSCVYVEALSLHISLPFLKNWSKSLCNDLTKTCLTCPKKTIQRTELDQSLRNFIRLILSNETVDAKFFEWHTWALPHGFFYRFWSGFCVKW